MSLLFQTFTADALSTVASLQVIPPPKKKNHLILKQSTRVVFLTWWKSIIRIILFESIQSSNYISYLILRESSPGRLCIKITPGSQMKFPLATRCGIEL